MQLSRKLQRFRTCRKNKTCSIFHDLSEYIIFSYGYKLLDWSFKGNLMSCCAKNLLQAGKIIQKIPKKSVGLSNERTYSPSYCRFSPGISILTLHGVSIYGVDHF